MTAVTPYADRREAVLAHLQRFPHSKFTAFQIGRVLGMAPGSVRNTLERMMEDGEVRQATCTRQMVEWELDTCQLAS